MSTEKPERLRVATDDGKYTVIQEDAGNMRFLRHRQPWPVADEEYQHVGMILALAQDLDTARGKHKKLQAAVNKFLAGRVAQFPDSRFVDDDLVALAVATVDV